MRPGQAGYTLVELIVVVVLIGLMFGLAVPAVRDTLLNDSLKQAARRLTGATAELRADAMREHADTLLRISLDENRFWIETADMTEEKRAELRQKESHALPEDVRIADIQRIGEKKQTEGEAEIRFSKQGYAQPAAIHLVKDDRYVTLMIEPFLSKIRTYDRYVDLDEKNAPQG